jgi:hypothetical protein
VVSFSEQTQEHWTTEIPACVICAYLAMYKGINLHLRLVQVVPNRRRLPRNWLWLSALQWTPSSRTAPHHGFAMVELSGQYFLLSLSC